MLFVVGPGGPNAYLDLLRKPSLHQGETHGLSSVLACCLTQSKLLCWLLTIDCLSQSPKRQVFIRVFALQQGSRQSPNMRARSPSLISRCTRPLPTGFGTNLLIADEKKGKG